MPRHFVVFSHWSSATGWCSIRGQSESLIRCSKPIIFFVTILFFFFLLNPQASLHCWSLTFQELECELFFVLLQCCATDSAAVNQKPAPWWRKAAALCSGCSGCHSSYNQCDPECDPELVMRFPAPGHISTIEGVGNLLYELKRTPETNRRNAATPVHVEINGVQLKACCYWIQTAEKETQRLNSCQWHVVFLLDGVLLV